MVTAEVEQPLALNYPFSLLAKRLSRLAGRAHDGSRRLGTKSGFMQ